MTNKTNFELVTPLELLCSKQVEMVVLPGSEGEIGVMPRHTPLMTILNRGSIKFFKDNKIYDTIIVDGGIAEISLNKIIVLSERAEQIDQGNKKIIEQKLSTAEKLSKNNNENISLMGKKDVGFYKFVLDKFN